LLEPPSAAPDALSLDGPALQALSAKSSDSTKAMIAVDSRSLGFLILVTFILFAVSIPVLP
jgi:hypothetical protein